LFDSQMLSYLNFVGAMLKVDIMSRVNVY
jgi:hypothetical protein